MKLSKRIVALIFSLMLILSITAVSASAALIQTVSVTTNTTTKVVAKATSTRTESCIYMYVGKYERNLTTGVTKNKYSSNTVYSTNTLTVTNNVDTGYAFYGNYNVHATFSYGGNIYPQVIDTDVIE